MLELIKKDNLHILINKEETKPNELEKLKEIVKELKSEKEKEKDIT